MLQVLHNLGYSNWYSKALSLAKRYQVNLDNVKMDSIKQLKWQIINNYKDNWVKSLQNVDNSRIIQTYSLVIKQFGTKSYLNEIKEQKYRIALSSHMLEI